MKGTKLWDQIVEFSRWVEFDAGALARSKNQDKIWIALADDASVERLWIDGPQNSEQLQRYKYLWQFLLSLGIRNLRLDPRLEMNQVQDVFVFLKSNQRALTDRNKHQNNPTSVAFLEGNPIHHACADITLQKNDLLVEYSYCTLKYSHLVHWLEKRNNKFRDHRSLFQMAPRYGLIAVALVLVPSILISALHSEWLIFWLLTAAAVELYGIIFIFLMVVGSVEYDNEEKAWQLTRAYEKLKFYASRIQADIKRASNVQKCFLPDSDKISAPGSVKWRSSYKPAEEVGGDYFDLQPIDDDRVMILFADVCGHGMAAALITAVLKTTFEAWAENPTSLEGLAARLNRSISRTTPLGDFAAVFMAILDCRTGCFEYINCGHNPVPWIISGGDGSLRQLDGESSMILGIQDNLDVSKTSTNLADGDRFLIVSDGIIENQDAEGNFYSKERLENLLTNNKFAILSELTDKITADAELFAKDTHLKDDQTVLAFFYKQP
ncbi:PP2C family protein-serine/threonine phosphatase [Anaerohalosphaera lusitana]|uniref:PP2C family protein-serine/threonine phosphatase n=1 Tax=Anaerohalosphaera lusitana TaxID=1936003 RepID=UPI0014737C87|nr:PP2C family protein-serine/threonine phosphatase [Anaerohalosphaera lusitana]